jgi:hypothetical protein
MHAFIFSGVWLVAAVSEQREGAAAEREGAAGQIIISSRGDQSIFLK